jgi:hypothetical protein
MAMGRTDSTHWLRPGELAETSVKSTIALHDAPWRRLYDYWLSKCVDGKPPARADLDPLIEIPHLVKNLMLMDVVPEGYRYRVLGSEIVLRHGLHMTGKLFGSSGVDVEALDDLRQVIDLVVATREPRVLVADIDPAVSAKNTVLILPLVSAAGQTTHILAGSFYEGLFAPDTRRLGMIPGEL